MSENGQHTGVSGFHRPVSPSEWWFAGHPDDTATTTQVVIEGTGHIDPDRLKEAVAVASAACPGSRLVRDGLTWVDSGITPPVHVIGGRGVDPVDVHRLPQLQATIAGPGVPTAEVVLIPGPITSIAFRANHSVMDAKGTVLWATDVFRVLRGEEPIGAPDPVSDLDIFAGQPAEDVTIPEYVREPVIGEVGETHRSRTVSGRLSLQGTHPGLVAKLATALVEITGLETGVFYVPVDLRHLRPGVRTTANVASGIELEVHAGEDWEEVHERLLRSLADGEATRKALSTDLLNIPTAQLNEIIDTIDRRARERNGFPQHCTISHAGRIALDDVRTPDFTAYTAYELARPAPGGPVELNLMEVDGRTEITMSWWESPVTAERIQAVLDRIEERISPAHLRTWDGNDTDRPLPDQANVVDLLLRQVEAHPDAIALNGPDGDVTYAEFAHRTAVVAAKLRSLGVGRETLVGVLGDRSVPAMIAVWGVIRAGAAYLPLDPRYPDARLVDVLGDAGAPVCVLTKPFDERDCLPEGCVPVVADDLDYDVETPDLDVEIHQEDLLYVIYTSGSTGRPKGVEIEHRSVTNYVHWASRDFLIDSDTRMPLIVSLSFDVAGNTIFLPLLAGGTVILRPGEIDHTLLRELIVDSGANCITVTPSHLDLISRLGLKPKGFRSVVSMGELLRRTVAIRTQETFGPDCKVINSYGPTETTIVMTMHTPFDPEVDTAAGLCIGRPTDNSTVFLLDSHDRFAAEGEAGEIVVGGVQVARGYRGRPELNRQKYIRLVDGTRVYRSGDIARLLPNGTLEFIARTDDQVKVLGHRIEPSEIAQALEGHPAVRGAVVVPRSQPGRDHKALVAYVMAEGVTAAELNEHVAGLLPKYMVPTASVFVDGIPQTINGKVDVRGLPDPFQDGPQTVDVSGRDELTSAVAGIWATTLGVPTDQIADDADFHQLGGNSVLLLSMLASVSTEIVGGAGEAVFMAELGSIIHDPTLDNVTRLARDARQSASPRNLTPAGLVASNAAVGAEPLV